AFYPNSEKSTTPWERMNFHQKKSHAMRHIKARMITSLLTLLL
ncbi:10351_t:CDS:1, partial [Rhizophagus irregularis]